MRRALKILLPVLASAALCACNSPTESDPGFDVSFTANPDPATASGPTGGGARLQGDEAQRRKRKKSRSVVMRVSPASSSIVTVLAAWSRPWEGLPEGLPR
jgi:hypothetical protein